MLAAWESIARAAFNSGTNPRRNISSRRTRLISQTSCHTREAHSAT